MKVAGKNSMKGFLMFLLSTILSIQVIQAQQVDIGIFGSITPNKIEIYMRPDFFISGTQTMTNIQYTVRWTDPSVSIAIDYIPPYFLEPQGPPILNAGYYYQLFASVPFSPIGTDLLAGEERLISSFTYSGAGSSCDSYEIINDSWTAANNGDVYFELAEDVTGIIYEPIVILGSVGGSVSGGGTITLGESTGTLTLTDYDGTINKWQKCVDAGSWMDIANTAATYSEIPSSVGTWEFRAEVQKGSCSVMMSESAVVIVNPTQNVWTGAIDTDWFIPTNWTVDVPDANLEGIIPCTAPHQPVICNATETAFCKDLIIEAGAVLNIDVCKSLTVIGTLSSYGTLTIAPGAYATITGDTYIDAAEGLVVQSTADGCGSFIDNGTITYGTNGTANVETYIYNCETTPNEFFMHFIGPSVDRADYTGSGTGVLLGAFNCVASSTFAYEWDETVPCADGWVNIFDETTLIPTAKGIALSTNDHTCHTICMTGELLTGEVTSQTLTASNNHYELISNPYPSAINFEKFYLNDGNSSIIYDKNWLWCPCDNTQGGNYIACADGVGGVTHIQKGQGFFVETYTQGAVSFLNSNRMHCNDPFREINANILTMKVNGGEVPYSDELIIRFKEGATNNYDIAIEAFKWNSLYEDATMIRSIADDGSELSINVLPPLDLQHEMVSVPVHFQCGYEGEYTFTATDLESFDYGTEIWIEDKQNSFEWYQLTVNNNTYSFTATADDPHDRFIIHFFGPTLINEGTVKNILIYPDNQYVIVKNLTRSEIIQNIGIYNLTGTKILDKKVPNDDQYRLYVSSHDAYYIVRVVTNQNTYIKKVFIH